MSEPTAAEPAGDGSDLETSDFTRELTELCRKHAVGIEGGVVWVMDMTWTGPDADRWAVYAIDREGRLVRTFR